LTLRLRPAALALACLLGFAALLWPALRPAVADDAPPVTEPPAKESNPCRGPHRTQLRCPDLQMGEPADMYLTRTARGRSLLHATNNVKNRGKGPAMLRGRRSGRFEMKARQHIYRVDGTQKVVATGAELYFYPVPGQGRYWKFHHAAAFELWSLDDGGHRDKLVRTGPKKNYCLRDLKHTRPGKRSPRSAVFPGCSQDPGARAVTLGTSVGWSDVYPSTYHEQYLDVTGLRGCFAYVHRADPDNGIWETDEANNAAQRVVRLPWGDRHKCP
jgi:hypothetical protein